MELTSPFAWLHALSPYFYLNLLIEECPRIYEAMHNLMSNDNLVWVYYKPQNRYKVYIKIDIKSIYSNKAIWLGNSSLTCYYIQQVST